MNSVLDTLQTWARRASAAAGLAAREPDPEPLPVTGSDPLAYRLIAWPELPEAHRTARVYRLMSTMSVRPVNRGWMLAQSRLLPGELDALLGQLTREHMLQVVDTSRFGEEQGHGHVPSPARPRAAPASGSLRAD